jgi:hypothetical protein
VRAAIAELLTEADIAAIDQAFPRGPRRRVFRRCDSQSVISGSFGP